MDIDSVITKIGFGKFHIISMIILGSNNAYFALQILTVTLIGPTLLCYWNINTYDLFLVTSMGFIGIMTGSVITGNLSDVYGRKPVLIMSNIGLIYCGVMSAMSPTVAWLICMQFVTGVFTSGLCSTLFALQSEITPVKYRGTLMVAYELFWAVESFLITSLCFLITPTYGWRIFILISNIPLIIVTIGAVWMPESPRFLLLHYGKEKCLKVMNRIAEMNKTEFIPDIREERVPISSFRDLIHRKYVSTTILTCLLSFIGCLTYYAVILLVTIINEVPHKCLQNMNTFSQLLIDNKNKTIDNSCCLAMTWETYKDMFVSIFAEVMFVPITMTLINLIGRKKAFAIYSALVLSCIFCLNFCLSPITKSVFLFFIRGSSSAYFSLNQIYSTEVFPTSVRSLGIGLGSTCARFGAVLSSFLVNIIVMQFSLMSATLSLCSLNFIGFIVSYLLPYETKDRKLYQTANDDYDNKNVLTLDKTEY